MRYKSLLLLLFACLFLFPSLTLAWQGKGVEVTDGETTLVGQRGNEVDVSLYGVDVLEKALGAFKGKAKQFAVSLAANKKVKIEREDRNQYGRIDGHVGLSNPITNCE